MVEMSFFKHSVASQYIVGKLRNSSIANTVRAWGADPVRLDATCDARKGGTHAIGFCATLDLEHCEKHLSNCLIITESSVQADEVGNFYVQVDDAQGAFIRLLKDLLLDNQVLPNTSIMSHELSIASSAQVHPSATLEPGIHLAEDVVIEAGCIIKRGTQIGRGTVVRENTVIGCDGIIVYRSASGERLKFPHLCGVIIGRDTEIGANCVIPKGILGSTLIGNCTIIGNMCNIGHGAVIEDDVWISVGGLIGGHARIETGATLGMGVRVRDNRLIGGKASIGMGSVVVQDVKAGSSVFGNPARRMPSLSTGPQR